MARESSQKGGPLRSLVDRDRHPRKRRSHRLRSRENDAKASSSPSRTEKSSQPTHVPTLQSQQPRQQTHRSTVERHVWLDTELRNGSRLRPHVRTRRGQSPPQDTRPSRRGGEGRGRETKDNQMSTLRREERANSKVLPQVCSPPRRKDSS